MPDLKRSLKVASHCKSIIDRINIILAVIYVNYLFRYLHKSVCLTMKFIYKMMSLLGLLTNDCTECRSSVCFWLNKLGFNAIIVLQKSKIRNSEFIVISISSNA